MLFNLFSHANHTNYEIILWSNFIIIVNIIVYCISLLGGNDICYMSEWCICHWPQKVLTNVYKVEALGHTIFSW